MAIKSKNIITDLYISVLDKTFKKYWSQLLPFIPVELRNDDARKTNPVIWEYHDHDDYIFIRLRFPMSKTTIYMRLDNGSDVLKYAIYERTNNVVRDIASIYRKVEEGTVDLHTNPDDMYRALSDVIKYRYAIYMDASALFRATGYHITEMDSGEDIDKSLYYSIIKDAEDTGLTTPTTRVLYSGGYRFLKDINSFMNIPEYSSMIDITLDNGETFTVEYSGNKPYTSLIGRVLIRNHEGSFNIMTSKNIRTVLYLPRDRYMEIRDKCTKLQTRNR